MFIENKYHEKYQRVLKKCRILENFKLILQNKQTINDEINQNLKTKYDSIPKSQILFEPNKLVFSMEKYKTLKITENKTKNLTDRSNNSQSQNKNSFFNLKTNKSLNKLDKFNGLKSRNSASQRNPTDLYQQDVLKKENRFKIQRDLEYNKKCKKYSNIFFDFINVEYNKYLDDQNPASKKNVQKYLLQNFKNIKEKLCSFKTNLNLLLNKDNSCLQLLNSIIIQDHESNLIQQFYQAFCYFIVGKMEQKLLNYDDSIRNFKNSKNLLKSYQSKQTSKLKLKCYKGLAFNFKKLNFYSLSKHYLSKYLQFALIINDYETELKAYDLIGIIYMYLQNINASKFYHEKAIKGITESKNSQLRQKSIQKLQLYTRCTFMKKEKDQMQPLSQLQKKYQDYSSDESFRLPISEKKGSIDKYSCQNNNKQMRVIDLNLFLKKIKKQANKRIRQVYKDEEEEQQQKSSESDQQFYKTYLSHLSYKKQPIEDFQNKKQKNKTQFNPKKIDYQQIQQKLQRINTGFNDLINQFDILIDKLNK